MKKSSRTTRDNQARYDKESDVYVGPSSPPFNVASVAQSVWFTHQPVESNFSCNLSPSSLTELARRCSTQSLQEQVKEKIEDKSVVEAARKRILSWGDSSKEREVQPATPDKKRKRSQRGQQAKETEASQLEEPLREIDASVPLPLQFTKLAQLSRYYHRDTLLEQTCIKQPVPTQLLNTLQDVPQRVSGIAAAPSSSLVLSISMYARPVRGVWAKERVKRLANGDIESRTGVSDSDSSTDQEDETSTKAERGVYGPLQLVQKMEILSTFSLQDLRNAFLCRMDGLPRRKEMGKVAEKLPEYTGRNKKTDSCFLIGDQLYSERSEEMDKKLYAILLEKHLSGTTSPRRMDEITLDSLSLSTGKLYWFLHQGSCEHLWNITSLRALRKEEGKRDLFPQTTYYASGAAISPLVKWSQPKSHVQLMYTLDKCDLCKGNQATMLVVGGSRFQSRTNINGLKKDTACVCQVCWYALYGEKPLASTSKDGVLSHRPPHLPSPPCSPLDTNCIILK